jgi:hypothetical protein
MKVRKSCLIVLILVLALLVITVGLVSAETTRTPVSGQETLLYYIPGKENFPADGKLYTVRDETDYAEITSDDPRLTGTNTFTFNANFKFAPEPVFVTGRMWGTFLIRNDGGYWEGTYTGFRDERGYSYFSYVGFGGGGYDGLQVRYDIVHEDPDPTTPYPFTGYIIDPGN